MLVDIRVPVDRSGNKWMTVDGWIEVDGSG